MWLEFSPADMDNSHQVGAGGWGGTSGTKKKPREDHSRGSWFRQNGTTLRAVHAKVKKAKKQAEAVQLGRHDIVYIDTGRG